MCCWSGIREPGNLNQHNTPLVTEVCAGEVTVTDPAHPLFGRVLKLSGLATLPGHVRHCHVETRAGCYGYVPVASTNRATNVARRPPESVLTAEAIADLLTLFEAESISREPEHERHRKSRTVAKPAGRRAGRRRQ